MFGYTTHTHTHTHTTHTQTQHKHTQTQHTNAHKHTNTHTHLSVDRMQLLKWIFKKWGVAGGCIGWFWFGVGTGGGWRVAGAYEWGNEPSLYIKCVEFLD